MHVRDIKSILVIVLAVLIVGLILVFVSTGDDPVSGSLSGKNLANYDSEIPFIYKNKSFRNDEGAFVITGFDRRCSEIFDKKIYFHTERGDDGKVDVLSLDMETRTSEIEFENISVNRISIENGYLIVSDGRFIRVYNLETKEMRETKVDGSDSFTLRAFSGKKLFYRMFRGSTFIWDIETGKVTESEISFTNITNENVTNEYAVFVNMGEVILYDIETGEKKILARFAEKSNPTIHDDYVFWVDRDKATGSDFNHLYCHCIPDNETFMVSDPKMNVSNSYAFQGGRVFYIESDSIEEEPDFEEGIENLGNFGILMSGKIEDGKVVSTKTLSVEYHRLVGVDACGNWVYSMTNRGGDPVIFGMDLYSIIDDFLFRNKPAEVTVNTVDLHFLQNLHADEDMLVQTSGLKVTHSDRVGQSIIFRKEYFDEKFMKKGD